MYPIDQYAGLGFKASHTMPAVPLPATEAPVAVAAPTVHTALTPTRQAVFAFPPGVLILSQALLPANVHPVFMVVYTGKQ